MAFLKEIGLLDFEYPIVFVTTDKKYAPYRESRGGYLYLLDYPDVNSFVNACRQLHNDESNPRLRVKMEYQIDEDYTSPEKFYNEYKAEWQKYFYWVPVKGWGKKKDKQPLTRRQKRNRVILIVLWAIALMLFGNDWYKYEWRLRYNNDIYHFNDPTWVDYLLYRFEDMLWHIKDFLRHLF